MSLLAGHIEQSAPCANKFIDALPPNPKPPRTFRINQSPMPKKHRIKVPTVHPWALNPTLWAAADKMRKNMDAAGTSTLSSVSFPSNTFPTQDLPGD